VINYRSSKQIQEAADRILKKELLPTSMFITLEEALYNYMEDIENSMMITYENIDVNSINKIIQKRLFPNKPEGDKFCEGDRIICLDNILSSFKNGDILTYNKYLREIDRNPDIFELAYAITIHKSQGSQYDRIFMYVSRWTNDFQNLYYTSVTRAKKELYIICEDNVQFLKQHSRNMSVRNTDI